MFRKPVRPSKPTRAPGPDEVPAPRKHHLEELLCDAVTRRKVVELRYEGDILSRTFEPAAVFWSTRLKVSVIGLQSANPNRPSKPAVRDFEIGKIVSVNVTEIDFQSDPINRHDPKYQNGIICSN